MFFFIFLDIHFSTKKSGKYLWNFRIQIICKLQRGPLFLPMLRYFKFWAAAIPYFLLPSYLVLCIRYRTNSYGISTFIEFAT